MDNGIFNYTQDKSNIVTIRSNKANGSTPLAFLDILESFAALITSLLREQRGLAGIIYYCPVPSSTDFYQELFSAAEAASFESRLRHILDLSLEIKFTNKPVVAILDHPTNSWQLAPMLWASHIIGTEKLRINLMDCKFGVFPGFGVTVYVTRVIKTAQAADLLLRSTALAAAEAVTANLVNEMATDAADASDKAQRWIQANKNIDNRKGLDFSVKDGFEAQIAPIRKKINPLFPGINACISLMENSRKLSIEQALTMEAEQYTRVLRSKEALGIMRTMYYGIHNAKKTIQVTGIPEYPFKKIGVLGAGMMGSGIAYELARAGIEVCLKDSTISQAQNGKNYTEKCCDKLIQLGKMTAGKKAEMLSLIHPTDQITHLCESDLIIEAVFEDKDLKTTVIAESAPFLRENGIFASNTTSLPITDLAAYIVRPTNFIGMHFFSPVDRMPLVEIIRGRQTSEETLNKAVQLALRLQKTPIVVHDSPAFFTSRIFFNYLLEAITLLLEGVPAADIEKEAILAGFAVSPLAVLDEISIPLMLHVYEQLPDLSSSQRRCYNYLSKLVVAGRNGRKSGKGFYTYDAKTGIKQIWEDETLAASAQAIDKTAIQNRLLHVMALDSYRCLDEGVLNRPIDGDIGSILGVGYAAHTGGVFAYMDEIGLQQFVKNCLSFNSSGEQWNVPSSLKKWASQNQLFYNGFKSNWPFKDK